MQFRHLACVLRWTLAEFDGTTHPRRFENLPRDGSVTRVQVDLDATDRDLILVRDAASRAGAVLQLELGAGREIVADIRLSADVFHSDRLVRLK